MKLGIIAGEASGDILGAGLIHALKQQIPDLQITGLGGPKMIAAGCQSQFDMERLSVMGLIEPLLHLPDLFKLRRQLYQHFIDTKPDLVIGIDSPEFNLGLEMKLRAQGIATMHYVSPSVWAWRQGRVHKIKKAVDLILTLFPFEVDFYHRFAVPAQFVGHPLADQIPEEIDKVAARQSLGLKSDDKIIAILPGSRRQEIHYLGETFLETAYLCYQTNPQLKFTCSLLREAHAQTLKEICQQKFPDLPITFFQQRSHDVMAAADAVLVSSGTATLEAMLYKRPMVIAYRLAAMTYRIAQYIVKTPHIGLPNLLANKRLVPEFIQHQANPQNLADALLNYFSQPEAVVKLQQEFLNLHKLLRCNASEQAAMAIIKQMGYKRV